MTFRKALFRLHLAVGLAAGAFLASMALSGFLIAFAPQILALSERGVARAASPEGPRREAGALLAAAMEASPGGRPAGLTLYRDPSAAAVANLGEAGVIFLDPRSGRVLGRGSRARELFASVEHWHRWLGSRESGKPFTGASALGLVFLSLSGLWLRRPRRLAGAKGALAPRGGLRGRARAVNRHNAIGLRASPLLLVIGLTGTVLAYRWAGGLLYTLTGGKAPEEEAGGRRGDAKPGRESRAKEGGAGSGARALGNLRVSLDSLAGKAGELAPAWRSLTLRPPRLPGNAWPVSVEEPGFAAFPRGSRFLLDGKTGVVSGWQPFAGQPAGRKLRAWAVPLHTGRGLGWPGQVLAALAALALLSQIWTGAEMAWRRFSGRVSASADAQAASE